MDALRRLALALGVTTDALVFEDAARGPDEELRLQFEALREFSPEEKTDRQGPARRPHPQTPGPTLGHRLTRRLQNHGQRRSPAPTERAGLLATGLQFQEVVHKLLLCFASSMSSAVLGTLAANLISSPMQIPSMRFRIAGEYPNLARRNPGHPRRRGDGAHHRAGARKCPRCAQGNPEGETVRRTREDRRPEAGRSGFAANQALRSNESQG